MTDTATPTLDISIDQLDYWKSLVLPVLVVRVDTVGNRIWAVWAKDLDPYPRSHDQKAKRFFLGDHLRLDDRRVENLPGDVAAWRVWRDHNVPFPIRVLIRSLGGPNEAERAQRLAAALRTGQNMLDETVRLIGERQDGAELVVTVAPRETRLATPSGPDLVIDGPLAQWWVESTAIEDVASLIAVTLGVAGYHQRAALMLARLGWSATWLHPPLAFAMVGVLAAGGQLETAATRIGDLIDGAAKTDTAVDMALVGLKAVQLDGIETIDVAAPLAERWYERLADAGDIKAGSVAYNLANHLRCSQRPIEAVGWYDRTIGADSRYDERSYFHQERGSALFESGRFEESAEAFARAEQSQLPAEILPILFADALVGCGRYAAAKQKYADATALPDPLGAEARLCAIACELAAELVGPEQRGVDTDLVDIGRDDREALVAALREDATNARAWLAMTPDIGLGALIAASAFSHWDAAALGSAAFAALESDAEDLARDLIVVARRYGGSDFWKSIREIATFSGRSDILVSIESEFDQAAVKEAEPFIVRTHEAGPAKP